MAILEALSLSIGAGEMLALVGESGSGKTIAALSVMRLLPQGAQMSGSIRLAGTEVTTLDDKAMRAVRGRDVGMVFQNPLAALNPSRTVASQIQEAWRVHQGGSLRAARPQAVELLGEVGLPDPAQRLDDYPHQFSGGMRQRVMIAMALACFAETADRRRADHRPGPADRRADHGADRPAAARACDGRPVRHP